ncbi:MAG: Phycobilisome 8.9 kDa linker polypeptide, phycocyanin-associated, rod [Chroococcopsis gigantea SAG 12.99]|jgi:phycocyanin-associated rod protein|nr:phycobilisome linker polypeptide [Chlorogloea purpurea SAG 13.99]MDV2999088.1 Phycobilisome 8.9 kDa linker polypeptide, phycocyanin-associated, rod [Chroococcopsis gigantea SAG 12.99]
MLSQSAIAGTDNSPSANRVFIYEVAGLKQNDTNDKNSYPLRQSGSVFIRVPYKRMNDEMRRITRMGGTIVSIKTSTSEDNAE